MIAVSHGSAATLEAGDHLSVLVEKGDVSAPGTISARPLSTTVPSIAGFRAAGPVVDIRVDAGLGRPLTLQFDPAGGPGGWIPVVWHQYDALGWYPVLIGDPLAGGDENTLSVDRSTFSPHLPGWLNPDQWVDAVADKLTGHTDPPVCEEPPPSWATVNQPVVEILVACGTSNPAADGAERVEARIRNNRGLVAQVLVPAGVDYASVDGQPEAVRELVRSITGSDTVLLSPGQKMTVGFRRPRQTTTAAVSVTPSQFAIVYDTVVRLVDTVGPEGTMATLLAVSECTKEKALLDPPDSAGELIGVIKTAASCVISRAVDPGKAATIAAEAVAAVNGVDVAVATGDKAFASRVDSLAGKLRLLGSVFKGGRTRHTFPALLVKRSRAALVERRRRRGQGSHFCDGRNAGRGYGNVDRRLFSRRFAQRYRRGGTAARLGLRAGRRLTPNNAKPATTIATHIRIARLLLIARRKLMVASKRRSWPPASGSPLGRSIVHRRNLFLLVCSS